MNAKNWERHQDACRKKNNEKEERKTKGKDKNRKRKADSGSKDIMSMFKKAKKGAQNYVLIIASPSFCTSIIQIILI